MLLKSPKDFKEREHNTHKTSTDVWQELGGGLQGTEKIKYLLYSCKIKKGQEASETAQRRKHAESRQETTSLFQKGLSLNYKLL